MEELTIDKKLDQTNTYLLMIANELSTLNKSVQQIISRETNAVRVQKLI